jgi:hypothetical protein
MKEISAHLQENKKLLKDIFKRQKELNKLVQNAISLDNKIATNNTFKWFTTIQNDNTTLLSKAV